MAWYRCGSCGEYVSHDAPIDVHARSCPERREVEAHVDRRLADRAMRAVRTMRRRN